MLILDEAEQTAVLSGRTPLNLVVARKIQSLQAEAMNRALQQQARERLAVARALSDRLSEVVSAPAKPKAPRSSSLLALVAFVAVIAAAVVFGALG